ncbi:MAG: hypothetical protein WC782_02640 [Methylococcaceae bacterium]|jgi:hypothetical protein
MPIFICLCLGISFLVETQNPQLNLLVSPIVIYVGLGVAIISLFGLLTRLLSETICIDGFASSSLLVWFAYWKPEFNEDAPIFFFFPLYFALITAFVSFVLVNQSQHMDEKSLQQMQKLVHRQRLKPWLIMLGILVSLYFEDHYLIYPTLVTLLIMRFALSNSIKRMAEAQQNP